MEAEERLAVLRHQRRLAHPPEEVWKALTNAADVMQWMQAPRATIDGQPNGQVDIETPLHITGRILTWEPPRVFEHEFQLAPSKLAPAGENAVLRYDLEPDGDGCLLTMTFTRLTPATARLFTGGIHKGLDRLAAHLDVMAHRESP
jgi:uncharacterized protein YndB with AHSA1/START domain